MQYQQQQQRQPDSTMKIVPAPVVTTSSKVAPVPVMTSDVVTALPDLPVMQLQDDSQSSNMDAVPMSSDSDSTQSQGSKSKRRGSRKGKQQEPQQLSPAPDTSSITKPIKTRPVDVDSVMERNRKNAIQARLNRQRKKEYIEGMEDTVKNLQARNDDLSADNERLHTENAALKEELEYVKNVLANQSALAGLLKNIGHPQGAILSSSFATNKRKSTDDGEQPRKIGGGLCVHVDRDQVSIEMCSKCSLMAQGTSRYDLRKPKEGT
jgi:hypothetical protein